MNDTWKRAIRDGVLGAWPICLGYLAIGLAFGIIAQKAGLNCLEIALMSLLVYAGSAQFIAVSMLGAGAGILPIVATTFTVNLRHVLMSSSLAIHLRNIGPGWLSLFSYGITDESFALNIARFRDGGWDWRRALVLNHTSNLTWVLFTVLGGYTGHFIPSGAFGIDYALIAMFICLLILQIRGLIYVIVALAAGVCAVILSLLFEGNAYIVIASIAAASLGVILKGTSLFREKEVGS
ncbi:MAG: AzlC family ABC transporter permease [Deltaproteobacteria bacterium]|nr:AzlC family ABC transporter permease [Deltaproteobacteria bacterium]